jgi:hypothetical protein
VILMSIRRTCPALTIVALIVGGAVGSAAADINGTSGPDVLAGTEKSDTIHGYAGADMIQGKGGADRLYGDRGADKLYGGGGADRLFPGDDVQIDVLRGGPGPDRISARTGRGLGPDEDVIGRDRVYAGSGGDVVTVRENWGWYMPFVDCGPGDDTVVVPFRMIQTHRCEHVVQRP